MSECAKEFEVLCKMKSVIYNLSKLKRLNNYPFPVNEVGLMVNHCANGPKVVLDRYFCCFSFNKEKYAGTFADKRPTFGVLPPGTELVFKSGLWHDELFFSYLPRQTAALDEFFNGRQEQHYLLTVNEEFNQDMLKLKELLLMRLVNGTGDKIDALAMKMITNACADGINCAAGNSENNAADMRINEIAARLKYGGKLEELLRKYGYSRRGFYYDWSKVFSVSPNQLCNEFKLGKAQQLLLTGQLPVAEIAKQCGFSMNVF